MDLEVKRDDLRDVRIVESSAPEPQKGQAVLRLDRFAVTANNVTYAVFGDAMSYWSFFPADDGWGHVPVWGYGEVESSTVSALRPGERVYGYFPMSTHLVVTPSRITEAGFVDSTAHRTALPSAYNQYQRVEGVPDYDPSREREYSILRPLFVTSFLLDDWLDDNDGFGARTIVVASASSKTALGLAFLASRRQGFEIVGLTSEGNAAFVRSVGYYDRVVTYDDVDSLPAATPTVFVDMAGGGRVLADVHRHFGDALRSSCLVGATHWEESPADPGGPELPGPAPQLFFAPDQLVKRRDDWGADGLDARIEEAWKRFIDSVDGWLTVEEHTGFDDLKAVWLEVLDGRAAPNCGHVVALGPT